MNLCPLCSSNHDNTHNIIDYDLKNYICEIHNDKYISYCKNCKKNLCIYCTNNHNNHEINIYRIEDKDKKMKELNELRKKIEILIKDIKEIKNILDNVTKNIEIYYNICNNYINNYDIRKINYETIENINQIINEDIIKDINKIINDNNVNNKINKIIEINNKIKKEEKKEIIDELNKIEKKTNCSLEKTIHHGIYCDKCGIGPIIGNRYKCSICNNYDLCEECELKNIETEEHKHNFIKMINKEGIIKEEIKKEIIKEKNKPNINIPKKDEKVIKIDEKNIEYKYELLSKGPKDLEKKVNEFVENEVKFQITIKNNFNSEWPGNGRTKLINDKLSDIKSNDIILNNLKFGQNQSIIIILNIKNIRVGLKKCIFHFSVDGKIYGNPLILKVNVH